MLFGASSLAFAQDAHLARNLVSLRGARGKRGIAAICIGGGQGGAMLVEALA